MSNLPRIMRGLGWMCFALLWVPFMYVMFKVPNGSYSFSELMAMPRLTVIAFGLMVGLGALAMLLLFGSSVVGFVMNRMVLSSGESGTARIVNIQPTGTRVNNYYYGVRFTLEVQAFGDTFQSVTEKLVPMHEMMNYQVGMTVNVKYNPSTRMVAMV